MLRIKQTQPVTPDALGAGPSAPALLVVQFSFHELRHLALQGLLHRHLLQVVQIIL